MANRITRKTITFGVPFQLKGMERPAPAGDYEVKTEEEALGDFMFPIYHRVSSTIYLPRPPGQTGLGEIVEIDPVELAAALAGSPEHSK